MFDFRNYSTKSKYYDDSNALVDGKIKDVIGDVSIEGFVELKLKINSILVSDSSQYKKAKDANENAVAEISQNEYKAVFLNKKCLKHVIIIAFKVKIIHKDLMKLTKFLYLALMTKCIFLIMELMC